LIREIRISLEEFLMKAVKNDEKKNFWQTTTGILTAITALIGAVGAFLTVLHNNGPNRPPPPMFPIAEVYIENFNKIQKVVSGKVLLSSDEQFFILVFAGKAGGPYWLQGASGSLFTETKREKIGVFWQSSWTVPEIHVGQDIVDLRAVAVFPKDVRKSVAAGIPDPQSGNAIKIENIISLPDPKKISAIFDPSKMIGVPSTQSASSHLLEKINMNADEKKEGLRVPSQFYVEWTGGPSSKKFQVYKEGLVEYKKTIKNGEKVELPAKISGYVVELKTWWDDGEHLEQDVWVTVE
jgi:hypothetical protein